MAGVGIGPTSNTSTPIEQMRRQRGLQHIPGNTSVLADDDLMSSGPAHEEMGGGPSELHGGLARHGFEIRNSSDPIRPE